MFSDGQYPKDKGLANLLLSLFSAHEKELYTILICEHTLRNMGLTHKQVSDWTKRGLIEDSQDKKWHRFSIIEIAFYKLVIELRKFGVSLEFIEDLKKHWIDGGYIITEGVYGKDKRAIFIPRIACELLKCLSEYTKYNVYFRLYALDGRYSAKMGFLGAIENTVSYNPEIQEMLQQPYIQINLNKLWSQCIDGVKVKQEFIVGLTKEEKIMLNTIRTIGDKTVNIEKKNGKLKSLEEIYKLFSDDNKAMDEKEVAAHLAQEIEKAGVLNAEKIYRGADIVNARITKRVELKQ